MLWHTVVGSVEDPKTDKRKTLAQLTQDHTLEIAAGTRRARFVPKQIERIGPMYTARAMLQEARHVLAKKPPRRKAVQSRDGPRPSVSLVLRAVAATRDAPRLTRKRRPKQIAPLARDRRDRVKVANIPLDDRTKTRRAKRRARVGVPLAQRRVSKARSLQPERRATSARKELDRLHAAPMSRA